MINKYFQIERKHIVTVQFIIEGYEGMATVSTSDAQKAIIKISIIPDYISDIEGLIKNIKDKYAIKEIFDYSEK